mgnify:CR=1 FL=1
MIGDTMLVLIEIYRTNDALDLLQQVYEHPVWQEHKVKYVNIDVEAGKAVILYGE